jgi:hypothetical protein
LYIKGIAFFLVPLFSIGIFYPPGEPISPHRLRCNPFAVDHYSFMGCCLAAAAISARKSSRLPELFIKTADNNNQYH